MLFQRIGNPLLEAPASLFFHRGAGLLQSRIVPTKVLKQSFKAIRRSQAGAWEREIAALIRPLMFLEHPLVAFMRRSLRRRRLATRTILSGLPVDMLSGCQAPAWGVPGQAGAWERDKKKSAPPMTAILKRGTGRPL